MIVLQRRRGQCKAWDGLEEGGVDLLLIYSYTFPRSTGTTSTSVLLLFLIRTHSLAMLGGVCVAFPHFPEGLVGTSDLAEVEGCAEAQLKACPAACA